MTMSNSAYLTDQQWSKVFALLKNDPNVNIGDLETFRRFINAIFWMLRAGCQWRLLPENFGHWNTVFKRFNAWSKKGV